VTGPSGASVITGALSGSTTPPTPVTVRTDTPAVGGTLGSNLSPAQLQAVRNALATGTRVTLTSGTGATAQNVTFSPTGRLSDADVNQALQLAAAQLAQLGFLNPTAEQLRVALFGGTLPGAGGTSILVPGVLQAEVRNTSDSRVLNTSASPSTVTSASPATITSASPPAGIAGAPAPSIGALPPFGTTASRFGAGNVPVTPSAGGATSGRFGAGR
jgi:hypothetical protein